MENLKIEGVAVISEDGSLFFDSGLPTTEPALPFEAKPHRGTISFEKNACFTFEPDGKPVALPPQMDLLLRDKNLIVRRTTRNFVVQMKFPIIEAADETNKSHTAMWKKVAATVKDARAKIKDKF